VPQGSYRFSIAAGVLLLCASSARSEEVLIWGGGTTREEADKAAAEWKAESASYEDLIKLPPRFPSVVRSDDIVGLNPGFQIVVLGFCDGATTADVLKMLKALNPSVYARTVKISPPAACPELQNATRVDHVLSTKDAAGNELRVAQFSGKPETAFPDFLVTLRDKTGHRVTGNVVNLPGGGTGGSSSQGDCEGSLQRSGKTIAVTISCGPTMFNMCTYPPYDETTRFSISPTGTLTSRTKSNRAKPTACGE
jgi:hypothetical protein